MSITQFQKGHRYRITGDTYSHGYPTGTIVRAAKPSESDGRGSWLGTSDLNVPASNLDRLEWTSTIAGGTNRHVPPSDVEEVQPEPLRAGDKARVLPGAQASPTYREAWAPRLARTVEQVVTIDADHPDPDGDRYFTTQDGTTAYCLEEYLEKVQEEETAPQASENMAPGGLYRFTGDTQSAVVTEVGTTLRAIRPGGGDGRWLCTWDLEQDPDTVEHGHRWSALYFHPDDLEPLPQEDTDAPASPEVQAAVEKALTEYKAKVEEVARRYATEHGWCSVVDRALQEVDIVKVSPRFKARVSFDVEINAPDESTARQRLAYIIDGLSYSEDSQEDNLHWEYAGDTTRKGIQSVEQVTTRLASTDTTW